MKREFLQNLKVGDMPLSKEVMDAIMEENGRDINAAKAGRRALAICTISDNLIECQYMTAEERQTSFTQMIQVGLETARRA